MTLTELIAEVYVITNRSDLTAETLSSVKKATLQAHKGGPKGTEFFYRDIYETGVTFPTSDYMQYIEYRTLIPRWRALKYLRKYDTSLYRPAGSFGKFFEIVTPESSLDSYEVTKPDICYIAGEVIQIRSTNKIQNALLGCYLNPAIGSTDETFISWIAIEQPWAIINLAASSVFRAIGKLDESGAQLQLAQQELIALADSNIIANGY